MLVVDKTKDFNALWASEKPARNLFCRTTLRLVAMFFDICRILLCGAQIIKVYLYMLWWVYALGLGLAAPCVVCIYIIYGVKFTYTRLRMCFRPDSVLCFCLPCFVRCVCAHHGIFVQYDITCMALWTVKCMVFVFILTKNLKR